MLDVIRFTDLLNSLAVDLDIDNYTLEYCRRRLNAEGASFLCVTLPAFSKHVLRCIEIGCFNRPEVPESQWSSFNVRKWDRIPPVFGVQLRRIFSRRGFLKKDPSAQALLAIRQFCEYLYKLALGFTPQQELQALEKYKSNENEVGKTVDDSFVDSVRAFAARNYFNDIDSYDQIIRQARPRDTSGAYAQSRELSRATKMRHEVYRRSVIATHALPMARHALPGHIKPSNGRVARRWLQQLPVVRGRFANNRCEVLFVPKDSRGPRVISKEPLAQLRFQMSFFDYMTSFLQRKTRRRILFDDQSVHRELARIGSNDGSWATMDLKDASDMVPYSVALAIFRHTPLRLFLDFRSEKALLPISGETVRLKKLSGMGSGLTFPTMALIIHAAVSYEIARTFRISEKKAMSLCYVYGDDLIVPTAYASVVESALIKVGLKLNKDKSFMRGPFRESCGADFLRGENVTPVRLRLASANLPSRRRVTHFGGIPLFRRRDAGVIVQLVRHANELDVNHLVHTAELFYSVAEARNQLGSSLPFIRYGSGVLGRIAVSDFHILSQPAGLRDHMFVPNTVSAELLLRPSRVRKQGHRAHDILKTYVEKLGQMDTCHEYEPFTGIGTRKKGHIISSLGCNVRRLAIAGSTDFPKYLPSIRRSFD